MRPSANWANAVALLCPLCPVKARSKLPQKRGGHVYSNNSRLSSLTLNLKTSSDRGGNFLHICRFPKKFRTTLTPDNTSCRQRRFFPPRFFWPSFPVFIFFLLKYWSDFTEIFLGIRCWVSSPREIFGHELYKYLTSYLQWSVQPHGPLSPGLPYLPSVFIAAYSVSTQSEHEKPAS